MPSNTTTISSEQTNSSASIPSNSTNISSEQTNSSPEVSTNAREGIVQEDLKGISAFNLSLDLGLGLSKPVFQEF